MNFDFGQLSGEMGGLLATAWAAGAAMTYSFCKSLFGKRIEELKGEIAEIRRDQASERIQCREDMARLGERIDDLVNRTLAREMRT